jgi:hypothetical protein
MMEWTEVAAYIAGALVVMYGVYWVGFVDHEGRSAHTMKVRGMDHEERMEKYGRIVTKARELNATEWSDTIELGPGEGKWITIASWLEDADGTRRPATPEDQAEFMERWDAEMKGTDDET